ncbi:LPS assembly lipoprotein LptE [Microvirga puerhi]|uniref:LPS assembly lipoprotein LptE n=1 Tax=Microvirga puerhi TaxID=2876078 RepID=A0ABS7VNA3_9HYPH|nr:LPS assembly lipoprotein LptE [Microvirga puerhi]MBZ6077008.1 LPS assembly lipoprotein LptE [Microvirga puerhi]
MSSLNLKGLARLAIVAGLSLGLSACFRPLYGPTASGETVQTILSSIEVPELKWADQQARVGHYIRSEIIYALNGSGAEVPKRYVLSLSLSQTLQSPIVDTVTGRAQTATIAGNLTYTLTSKDGGKTIATGTATSYATYERFPQRFATVRAARDAEIRLAKALADQVKTRIAMELATTS